MERPVQEVDQTVDPHRALSPHGTQTLLRGLHLLEYVGHGLTDVRSLAERLGTPRSTTHRMLNSLVADGYLHRMPDRGYVLGPKLIQLGVQAVQQRPVVQLAAPHLAALEQATGDTVHLGQADGDDVVYLDKRAGSRGLQMSSRVGMRMPMATTGLGKALMLGLSSDRWRVLYDVGVRARGSADSGAKPLAWDDYVARMTAYCDQGWVMDLEENETDIRCVGAPVRDISGRVVASISLASAIIYMPLDRMEKLGPMVLKTAQDISRDLGWAGAA